VHTFEREADFSTIRSARNVPARRPGLADTLLIKTGYSIRTRPADACFSSSLSSFSMDRRSPPLGSFPPIPILVAQAPGYLQGEVPQLATK